MKSAELFDNNNDEANSILLEIWEPNLIVLPIPERTTGANISLRLWLKLINQTLKPWKIHPDGIIIPELIAPDGKFLERELTTDNRENEANRPYQGDNLVNKVVYFISNLIDNFAKRGISWVSPKRGTFISITANICWKKDLLQLKLLTNRYQALNSSFFDGLKPENYQLRFIYSSSSKIKPQSEKETLQARNIKQIKGDRLTTSFVNLRLVELTKPNDRAVEVDGIRFETILPETVLNLPEKIDGMALWGYYIFLLVRSLDRKMLVVAIAYLVFTITWFECAQFTHIAWWSMSVQSQKHTIKVNIFHIGYNTHYYQSSVKS